MKKVLITGANSYIGESFASYIEQSCPGDIAVDTVDMVDGTWRDKSFQGYDAVFHVAGIAHQKETKENAPLCYKVNRDLAIETAKKAKEDGVRQFIFMSSMSVYGKDVGIITRQTMPEPRSNYGKAKLQAEEEITALGCESFKVCALRPPMVYGEGCKGNFQTVVRIVKKFPLFPRIKNQRSMIYIDNLTAFIRLCVEKELSGVYFPQNREYAQTVDMARAIAKKLGKRRYFSYILGFGALLLRLILPIAKKGFGSLIYKDCEDFDYSYCVIEGKESFERSV